ncbi:TPA: G5 domain-containing protein [Streptococcus pneumoniae]|nr:G5 domain-containing protein [Streptococcus pneumoniae]
MNTSFAHAADGIQYVRDDTRDKKEGIEYDDADNGDIIVKVATKPKVVTKKISSTRIRFEKDETKDRSENPVTIDGEDGYVTTTRTYDVNPETGYVTEQVTVDRKEATDTVIKVPAKSKIEEVLVPFATKYEADNDLSAGQEQEITLGKNGKTVTTITYNVDGKSGQVTESTLSQKKTLKQELLKKEPSPKFLSKKFQSKQNISMTQLLIKVKK